MLEVCLGPRLSNNPVFYKYGMRPEQISRVGDCFHPSGGNLNNISPKKEEKKKTTCALGGRTWKWKVPLDFDMDLDQGAEPGIIFFISFLNIVRLLIFYVIYIFTDLCV